MAITHTVDKNDDGSYAVNPPTGKIVIITSTPSNAVIYRGKGGPRHLWIDYMPGDTGMAVALAPEP